MANYSVVSLFGNRYLIIWANNWQIDIDLFFARSFILLYNMLLLCPSPIQNGYKRNQFWFPCISKLALTLGWVEKQQPSIKHMCFIWPTISLSFSLLELFLCPFSLSPHVIYSFINNSSQDIRYGSLFFRMWYRNIPMIMIFYRAIWRD